MRIYTLRNATFFPAESMVHLNEIMIHKLNIFLNFYTLKSNINHCILMRSRYRQIETFN